jgi:hypothetical protein
MGLPLRKYLVKSLKLIDNAFYESVGPIRILFVVRNGLGMSCLLPLIKEAQKRTLIKITITEEFEGCYDWPEIGEINE